MLLLLLSVRILKVARLLELVSVSLLLLLLVWVLHHWVWIDWLLLFLGCHGNQIE